MYSLTWRGAPWTCRTAGCGTWGRPRGRTPTQSTGATVHSYIISGFFLFWLAKKKEKTCHGLKAGVKLDEEGRLEMHGQDPPLHHRRLQVIVLHDDVLLQYLDGVDLISPLPLRQHHLPKWSSAWMSAVSGQWAIRGVRKPDSIYYSIYGIWLLYTVQYRAAWGIWSPEHEWCPGPSCCEEPGGPAGWSWAEPSPASTNNFYSWSCFFFILLRVKSFCL